MKDKSEVYGFFPPPQCAPVLGQNLKLYTILWWAPTTESPTTAFYYFTILQNIFTMTVTVKYELQ